MKEIVDKILQEEEETRKKIKAVEQENSQMLERVKKQAQDDTEAAIRQTRLSIQQTQEESEAAFLSEKETLLTEARQKTAALRQAREKDIDRIADEVFSRIIEIKDR
ncbi:MAG TPA: hypothetical protein VMD52_07795 [Patescibacteria group bacterium]|nr:hypothetical protein [Patescibacteria group bacterium]